MSFKPSQGLSMAMFVCYFVFDWWGVSTATQIRLYAGLLSALPLCVGAKRAIGVGGGLVRERGVPRRDAVFRSSVWGSLFLLVEVQGSESRVS